MKKNGFTLVELLAVIAILCITITIVIVQVDKNLKDATDLGNKMQIESIESAALLYVENTNSKILMLEPFLLYAPDKEYFRVDLNPKIDIMITDFFFISTLLYYDYSI